MMIHVAPSYVSARMKTVSEISQSVHGSSDRSVRHLATNLDPKWLSNWADFSSDSVSDSTIVVCALAPPL